MSTRRESAPTGRGRVRAPSFKGVCSSHGGRVARGQAHGAWGSRPGGRTAPGRHVGGKVPPFGLSDPEAARGLAYSWGRLVTV